MTVFCFTVRFEWILQPSKTGLFEFRSVFLFLAANLVQCFVNDLDDVELVKRYGRTLERVFNATDEGRGHVAASLLDVFRATSVSLEIFFERRYRCCILARSGEKDLGLDPCPQTP